MPATASPAALDPALTDAPKGSGWTLGLQVPDVETADEAIRRATFILHLGPDDQVAVREGYWVPGLLQRTAGKAAAFDPSGYRVFVRRRGKAVYRATSRHVAGLPQLVDG